MVTAGSPTKSTLLLNLAPKLAGMSGKTSSSVLSLSRVMMSVAGRPKPDDVARIFEALRSSRCCYHCPVVTLSSLMLTGNRCLRRDRGATAKGQMRLAQNSAIHSIRAATVSGA